MITRADIVSTLVLSAALLFTAPLAHAADPFVDVIAGEASLKMVFDHGDVCEFIIEPTNDKDAAAALSQKITKLYDLKPTVRGTTRAWDIQNSDAKSTQSKTVSILIKQQRNGRYHLVMDRRRGGDRHNSQTTKANTLALSQSRSNAAPARPAAPPARIPPPATTD
ncbi:hypothetical protein [Fretibacter rubidus]|uniref:hypothetical protein n=1 Tax=Fretibacter rubidus TaxID=570162 RepID=UPI00352AD3F4